MRLKKFHIKKIKKVLSLKGKLDASQLSYLTGIGPSNSLKQHLRKLVIHNEVKKEQDKNKAYYFL